MNITKTGALVAIVGNTDLTLAVNQAFSLLPNALASTLERNSADILHDCLDSFATAFADEGKMKFALKMTFALELDEEKLENALKLSWSLSRSDNMKGVIHLGAMLPGFESEGKPITKDTKLNRADEAGTNGIDYSNIDTTNDANAEALAPSTEDNE